MKRTIQTSLIAALAFAASVTSVSAADKMTFAVPAIPPVFGAVVAYTAKEVGIAAKYNIDLEVKPFDSGAAAANAVNAGSVDFSLSPTQFVATMISNSGAKIKAIWGMEKSDWLITSMDGAKTNCNSMKGQGVGVDSVRGARWIQLDNYLRTQCKLVTDTDVNTVPLSSNVGTAMASGQLVFGVLHTDDVPVIERMSKKKIHIIAEMEKVVPDQHYLAGIARADNLAAKRDMYVRLLAALRDTTEYMKNPANADKVAAIANVTSRELPDAKAALAEYNKMEYWPIGHAGLTQKRVDSAINSQIAAGKATKGKAGIDPEKTAVTYKDFVDLSVWNDAAKVKK
ncbi:MAG: ABC-type nitrate/sulfonate/bicarbonate transport system periplasmic component-like protein [Rhodospirillales bacterium]|nr:ABC-type nitrate/sulfonate/bicarbonate transport system periplasmic component-like protein [Rhodospirillales bacterium]